MSCAGEPRVLLSAYQCGPAMGSVSQIGWEWYSRMAKRIPTTLFTHSRNREAIEGAGGPLPCSEVVYIDTEWFAGPLYRLAKRMFPSSEHPVFLVSSLDFFLYDAMVVRAARQRMKAGQSWDVAHQVTPVSPVAPTRLHALGVPVVIGPINGGLENPKHFPDVMKQEGRWVYPVRHLARWIDAACGSSRNAAAILTATQATLESVPDAYRHVCVPLLENAVDLDRFPAAPWPAPPSETEPLRILFVGRLIAVKGIPMLLDALVRVRKERPVELSIVGDGPMREPWQGLAKKRGLDDIVTFAGARTLDEVAAKMRWAHVFCLASVRESGGAVLLEAMASARPILTVAYGGPGEIVDDSVGRGIAPEGAAYVTDELVDSLLDASWNSDVWRAKGEEGRRVAAARYSWESKMDDALALYGRLRASDFSTSITTAGPGAARPLRSGV